MTKGKRGLALAMSLIAVALTACGEDYTYPDASWKDGEIVTVGGKTYKFDEIYKAFEGTKTSAQSYFNVAKSVLAQSVTKRTDAILSVVDTKIEKLHDTWKTNARTNNTSYKEEQEKTFDSEGVEDEDELREKYISQEQVTENSNAFASVVTSSDTTDSYGGEYYISEEQTKKYVEENAPYHVSHILIKVDAASGGEGYYNGQISSDDAKQIANVTRMLSSGTEFGSVAQIASDDSSNTQYGELYTSKSMIAMQKDTSYVNEFKLGVYAYDTFINKKVGEEGSAKKETISESLRVPGTTEGTVQDSEVSELISATPVAEGKAFGIPLSVCFEMNQVAEWEKNPHDGSSIKTQNNKSISARQYARNVLFNNYFNYRGVSFIYDDSDEFDTRFLAEVNAVNAARKDVSKVYDSIPEFLSDTDSYLDYKRDEYNYIKKQLGSVKAEAFSDDTYSLVGYQSTKDGKNAKTEMVDLGEKKILSSDKNPIIVARAGTSGDSGYQGIHFIVVNNDPFTQDGNGDYTQKYKYYRCNVPSDTKAENAPAYSLDYKTNPSFINFVNTDSNSTTTYNGRRESLEAVIKSSLDSEDIALWEYNLKKFKEATNKDFLDYLPAETKNLINMYITLTKQNSQKSDEDSLDSSWETYVQELLIQEELAEERMVPTFSLGSFEAGYYDSDMEEICYVD